MRNNYSKILTFLGTSVLVLAGVLLIQNTTQSSNHPFGVPKIMGITQTYNEAGVAGGAVNTILKMRYTLAGCDTSGNPPPGTYPTMPIAVYIDGSLQPLYPDLPIVGPPDYPSAPLCGNAVEIDARNIPTGNHSVAMYSDEWGSQNVSFVVDHTVNIVVSLPPRTPALSALWNIFNDTGPAPCTVAACNGTSGQTFNYSAMRIPDNASYTIVSSGATITNVNLTRFAEKNPMKRFLSSLLKKAQADSCSSTDSCTVLGGGQVNWEVTPFTCTVTINTQANGNGVNLTDGSGGVVNSTPNTTTALYTVTDSVGNVQYTGSKTISVAGGSYTITPSGTAPRVNIGGTSYVSDINSSSVLTGLCSNGAPPNTFSIGYRTRPVLDVK